MHELRWVRENPEEFGRGLARRGLMPRAKEVLALDREWRALETAAQEAQATRNRLSREVGGAEARGGPAEGALHKTTPAQEAQGARNRLSREVGAAKARGEPVEALLNEIARGKDAEAANAANAAG